jgi:Xaa-Pro aminopeptidase
MNFQSRIERLRTQVKKTRCDALLISHSTNIRHACGFTGTAGLLLLTPTQAHFCTDFRYQEQAAQQLGPSFKIHIAKKGLFREAARVAKAQALSRIGIEAEHVTVAAFEEMQKLFAPSVMAPTKAIPEGVRLQKDAGEMEIMRRAIALIDEVFAHACGMLKPGLSEREVAEELHAQMRARGASGPSFDTIVASGIRGALPHGVASDKKIEHGDMVTIDMGAKLDDYCSDFTRTVCIGKPTAEQQKVYETVWDAQVRAGEAMRAGIGCKEADGVARKIITDAGYGKYFGHGLGHGVGLDIHEAPRISPLGKGKLADGSVVSCEPGIYIPNWGGVRIEDLLLVGEGGSEVLSKGDKPRTILKL